MTAIVNDILTDIPDEDLPELAKMYEEHQNWAPYAYSIIKTGIEWRRKCKEKSMVFMSPNGCWNRDGTFFVLLKYYSFDILLFSLDDSGNSLYEGITKTKRFHVGDYKDRPPLLFSVHNKFQPIVARAFRDKGMPLVMEIPCHMFSIPKDEALNFKIECSEEVYITKLDKTHANLVNSLWPHQYNNSINFITLLIEMNGAYGLFLKSNDELVSWALLSMLGQLSMIQTVDAHKQKGYGSLITKYLSKEIATRGFYPFGTVLEENVASVNMFSKLGFKNLGLSIYSFYKCE